MADSLVNKRTRVAIVPSIANIAAPTVAELNAGILATMILTPDGLIGFEPTTAPVDTSGLGSEQDTARAGVTSYSSQMLRCKKQESGDTLHSTIGVRGVQTNVVIRRNVDRDAAWASSQAVAVHPIETGDRRDLPPVRNEVAKYEVPCFPYLTANMNAVVA